MSHNLAPYLLHDPLVSRYPLPAENLRHASVGDLEDPGDVAGPRPGVRQLDDLLPGRVREGSARDEHAPELVDPRVP